MLELGVIFAVAALFSWGIGDFLIQRTTRKIGDWEALFVIVFFGAIILSPFVYADLFASFTDSTFIIMITMSVVMLFAAILDFEALKKGKLAIAEPFLALEVPVTTVLAFAVVNEGLQATEIFLVTTLIIGLVLVSVKSHHFKRKIWLEKGVLLMAIGATLMGIANFLMGFASRITNPLLANWFLDVGISAICIFYIILNHRTGKLVNDFKKNKKLILAVSIFDNAAWISFAIATTMIPIAIAIALSESYIALAVLLGILKNKEIIERHQKIGLITATASTVLLAVIVA